MIHYLYHLDYDPEFDPLTDKEPYTQLSKEDRAKFLTTKVDLHVGMYIMADRFGIKSLKLVSAWNSTASCTRWLLMAR